MRSSFGVGMTPPKVRRRAEADVVGHDQQNVRRALRRHYARRPGRRRLCSVELDLAVEWWRRRRKVSAVDRCRGVRRAGHSVDLLSAGSRDRGNHEDNRQEDLTELPVRQTTHDFFLPLGVRRAYRLSKSFAQTPAERIDLDQHDVLGSRRDVRTAAGESP